MTKFFRNPRVLRVLRPAATVLGLGGALWHALHMMNAYVQHKEHQASDPALSNYFWGAFQSELGVTLASFVAGLFAWHMFKPKPEPPQPA